MTNANLFFVSVTLSKFTRYTHMTKRLLKLLRSACRVWSTESFNRQFNCHTSGLTSGCPLVGCAEQPIVPAVWTKTRTGPRGMHVHVCVFAVHVRAPDHFFEPIFQLTRGAPGTHRASSCLCAYIATHTLPLQPMLHTLSLPPTPNYDCPCCNLLTSSYSAGLAQTLPCKMDHSCALLFCLQRSPFLNSATLGHTEKTT